MSIMTPDHYRRKVGISFKDSPTMTEQSHKDTCEIKNIMGKARKTGIITHQNSYHGTYGDFISAPDYQEAQNKIADAKSMFETVPADIRAQFHNSAKEYLEFIQEPSNRAEMQELGLDTSHFPPEAPRASTTKNKPTPTPTPPEEKKPDTGGSDAS